MRGLLLVAASTFCVLLAVALRLASDKLVQSIPRSAHLATPLTQADAAIALGYALRRDGSPTRALRARVEAAERLWEQGAVQWLVFSGGHPGGGLRRRSEAAVMAEYAQQLLGQQQREGQQEGQRRQGSGQGGQQGSQRQQHMGPLPSSWLLEEESTSTRENALLSLRLLQNDSETVAVRSVAVATNPFHQLRSWLTFRCAAKQLILEDVQVLLAYVQPLSAGEGSAQASGADGGADGAGNPAAPGPAAAAGAPGPAALPLLPSLEELWVHVDVVREVAALAYYWWRGWLC